MASSNSSSDWYAVWFDSPHYHQLYGHRSQAEASAFIGALHQHAGWSNLELLDLACGKGRHAKAAAALGHRVTGIDLSKNSIREARQLHSDTPGLEFVEGDMRSFQLQRDFDGVLNLFTSFGYFKDKGDHLAVLRSIHAHLKPNGFLILDFLDAEFTHRHLVPSDVINRDGVEYHIERKVEEAIGENWPHFIKRISLETPDGVVEHVERVAALEEPQLSQMLAESGFEVLERWGNYALAPWKKGETPRLILHARKS